MIVRLACVKGLKEEALKGILEVLQEAPLDAIRDAEAHQEAHQDAEAHQEAHQDAEANLVTGHVGPDKISSQQTL